MTHVWPSDDNFTDGATAYGDYPGAYIKASLFSTATTLAHPTSGSYTFGFSQADLLDVYSPSGGSTPKYATPQTTASYLWRTLETANDVVVSLGFQVRLLTGSAHDMEHTLPAAFVAARVKGGSYVGATNSYTSVDAYCFGFVSDATLDATWYLLRVNGGTVTVLDSEVFRGSGSLLTNVINPLAECSIVLDCSTNGSGNAVLVGKVKVPSRDGSAALTSTVFTYTDTSGSKLTAAGRCGFGLSGVTLASGSPGGYAAPYSTYFQIEDDGSLYMRDEWVRAWRQAATAVSQTVSTTTYTGYSLASGWAGDYFSAAAFQGLIYRSQVGGLADRINFDPSTDPVGDLSGSGGFIASQRRATDKKSQNRSVQIRFSSLQQDGTAGTTSPTSFRAAGIFVRCSGTGTPSASWVPTSGYNAVLVFTDSGPTCDVHLYRWFHGAPTLLAIKTGVSVSINTNYTFRLDAYNQLDASGQPNGSPVIRVFIGGVQVALVKSTPSVTVTTAGTVSDGSSQATLSGAMEGLYLILADGDKTVFFDTWAEGSLTNQTTGGESDQASIALSDELQGGSLATWNIQAEWPVEEEWIQPRAVAKFESRHKRRAVLSAVKRRRFRLSARAISEAQRDALLTIWDTVDGVEGAFTWTPPRESSSIYVRFVDPSLGDSLRDVGVHSYSIGLEQVLT